MASWKIFPIGFHIGPGGNADGLDADFLIPLDAAGIRWCLKSVDQYPLNAVNIARASGVPHTIVWRSTSFDVPDYDLDPVSAAHKHFNNTLLKIPQEFDRELVWLESINEVDKNRASWLGYFASEWTKLAWQAGFQKVLHFGWSSGEPEPEHWLSDGMREYLKLAAAHPNNTGVSIHEYSYTVADIMNMYPWLIGRYRFLFDACDKLGIPRVTTCVTEWGWEYQDVPNIANSILDIDTMAREYVQHPEIIGAGLWYLGPGFDDIAAQAQPLIKPTGQLALNWQHYIEHPWPRGGDTPPPPPPPPPPPEGEMFVNWSFEEGTYKWEGVDELNIPNSWDFWHAVEDVPNPIDPNPWAKFVRPESVTPGKGDIPVHEHDQYFLDGDRVLKIFKGSGSIYFTVSQKVWLEPGTYKVRMPIFADLVKGYTPNGEKVWADDPAGNDGLAWIGFGSYRGNEISLTPGVYNYLEHTHVFSEAGEYDIGVEIMLPFPLAQNGVFMDAFTLALADGPPPPSGNCIDTDADTRYHILRPRSLTDGQWTYIKDAMTNGVLLPNLGTVAIGYEGWSHVDAIGAIKRSVEAGYTNSRLVVVDGHWIGTGLDPAWMAANCPVVAPYTVFLRSSTIPFEFKVWPTNYKAVTQFFGANKQNYLPFGLPGHDGVDIRAPHGSPIFAVADGKVYRVHTDPSTHNYGIHVRVEHADGWKTIYAHFDRAVVVPNQYVKAGDILGYADNTGNSFGSHLHLGLKRDGYTYTDENGESWPFNLHDPTPYLEPLCPACFASEPPAPPAGSARLGLHASADPGLASGEASAFQQARIDLVKVLSTLPDGDVTKLANACPGSPFVIRAFLHFGGRSVSPKQFFDWTVDDVRRTVDRLKDRQVAIELHNEPNLIQEGHGVNWGNGRQFGEWVSQVLFMYEQAFAGYKFVFPGLSPGGDVGGIRYDSTRFLQEAGNIIPAFDYLGVHAYWAANWPMGLALATVDQALAMYPGSNVIVTEASNNRRDTPQANKALEYIEFWRALQQRPRVYGVTYFVSSASNEAWGWNTGTGEIWVGTSIPGIVGARS